MTLLLQRIANETNAPLHNIVTTLLQPLPLRHSSTSATQVLPSQGAEDTTQLDTQCFASCTKPEVERDARIEDIPLFHQKVMLI